MARLEGRPITPKPAFITKGAAVPPRKLHKGLGTPLLGHGWESGIEFVSGRERCEWVALGWKKRFPQDPSSHAETLCGPPFLTNP